MDPKQTPSDGDGFSDSDQAWWDRLTDADSAPAATEAGRRAQREADGLRRALALEREAALADPRIAEATSAAAREQRWQQLQFRLRREGLAAARRPAWHWQAGVGGALAASVLVGVLWVQQPWQEAVIYDEGPVWRGELDQLRLPADRPRQAAEQLAAELRQAGQAAALHQQRKVFSVDVMVTPVVGLLLPQALAPLLVEQDMPWVVKSRPGLTGS